MLEWRWEFYGSHWKLVIEYIVNVRNVVMLTISNSKWKSVEVECLKKLDIREVLK